MSAPQQRAINLSRVKRCGQQWEGMPRIDGGRHCLQCDKRIVDLTRLTPAEIASVHLSSAEPVCGRYTDEQLSGAPHEAPVSDTWRRSPVLASLLSLLLAEPKDAVAQQAAPIEQSASTAPDRSTTIERADGPAVPDTLVLHGQVLEKAGKGRAGVPFVNVQVVGTEINAVTDIEGHFALDLSTIEGSTDSVSVEVMYLGYARQRQRVALRDPVELVFDFTGTEQEAIVFAVQYKKPPLHKRVWRGIRSLFSKRS